MLFERLYEPNVINEQFYSKHYRDVGEWGLYDIYSNGISNYKNLYKHAFHYLTENVTYSDMPSHKWILTKMVDYSSFFFHPITLANFTDSYNYQAYYGFEEQLFSVYPSVNKSYFSVRKTYECADGRVIDHYDPTCRGWY